jgi:RNA polymerase sigma-70 factor, ECF subfamily
MQSDSANATDEELAGQAQAGFGPPFETLVCRYETRVFEFLRRSVGCVQDAEDLTQQVFLQAYRGLPRFQTDRRFATWVFTIARRVAISHHRKARPEMERDVEPAEERTPFSILADRESESDLWNWARSQLSDNQFTALWLQISESFTVRDIAVAMGKTQTHVKVLLYRGRRCLAKAWGQRKADVAAVSPASARRDRAVAGIPATAAPQSGGTT